MMTARIALLTAACFLTVISFGQHGAVDIPAPQINKVSTQEPSSLFEVESIGFFNPAEANNVAHWNPSFTIIPAPRTMQPPSAEEVWEKTQLKLEHNRQHPEGFSAAEEMSRSMADAPLVGDGFQILTLNSGGVPPDNAGAISGDGHIVACKNSVIGFYDEDGNTTGQWTLADFFSEEYTVNNFVFDPRVIYSNYHNRFIVLALGGNNPENTNVLVAFSVTSDPNDGFHKYSFDGDICAPDAVWFDYPQMAVSASDLFVSGNLFGPGDDDPWNIVYQIDMANAWTGGELNAASYCGLSTAAGGQAQSIVPLGSGWSASILGIAMVSESVGQLTYYIVDDNLSGSPTISTYEVTGEGATTNAGNVPQLGTDQMLSGGGYRLRHGFYYGGIIHTVQTVGDDFGYWRIRYSQIDIYTGVVEQDELWAIGYDYTYPCIAPWGATSGTWDGSVVIGFLRSSSTIYPEFRAVRYDNGWQGSFLLKQGESPIEAFRWGDYIDSGVRENQGHAEVWMFGQYGKNNGHASWTAQLTEVLDGCTDPSACNYNPDATVDDGSCILGQCEGCMDATACNYVPTAVIGAECIYPGCTNSSACNYSPLAGCDDGSCCFGGCVTLTMTDTFGDGWNGATWNLLDNAGNTLASGTMLNGSEEVVTLPCLEEGCYDFTVSPGAYESEVGWTITLIPAQVVGGVDYTLASGGGSTTQTFNLLGGGTLGGCTDATACNFNPDASCDDESCCYDECLTVHMTDAFGDGWNGGVYEIVWQATGEVVATGELEYGLNGVSVACLTGGCYEFRIVPGFWPNEIGWSLEGADEVGLSGGADDVVTFTMAGGGYGGGCTDSSACNYDPSATCDNGTCCFGNCGTLLMMDTYGDGWNGAVLTITDEAGSVAFETTMEDGSETTVDVCLADGCYLVDVSNSDWPGEASWILNMYPNSLNVLGGGDGVSGMPLGINSLACGLGCTYIDAVNFDSFATVDDGTCEFDTGCGSCAGDLDGNGTVNTADLLEFLSVYGTDCSL
jgi:hypothetical protein